LEASKEIRQGMMPSMNAPQPFLLPPWAEQVWARHNKPLAGVDERMRLVIRLAWMNVEQGHGHPFGAAVFDIESGALVAIGVNLVTQMNCSLAHAEMVALAHAQQQLKGLHLEAAGQSPLQLVTSCEPCAMCFGAIPFSGVHSVVCGARAQDAETIGFDQGMKPEQWSAGLEQRGIVVITDVARGEAVEVFSAYQHRTRS
jgi:tRNA(Arg) A34 adenosine deaminase TadA